MNDTLENLTVVEIQQYQQNRYPLLFIDFVEEAIPGKSAKGYKNFTFNEWFFPVHFEDEPNVPGFVQIEALTQMFLMTFLTLNENKGKKTGFVSIKNAHFKRKVIPGDRMDINASLDSFRRGLAYGTAKGFVDSELACSIKLVVAIPDILNQFIPRKE
ncbi:beta-hydroxyacyl-ACP dehydratase [Lysinibacillus sp. A4]|uniref:3-hydroxyacyl-ACP dehydratase FabZ family protein n=1 Tax=Lysinibacillus sp. A4 TaxID=2976269 RepID=UPI00217606A2|nr:3-hydroxyacyl-ACP dehydratase FabZ family protein [Lysinibacillus sp. A4]MCS5503260.1 beta-hydroxyacyl-ACP dehydratase [Lysinibacillus sp. A4]